MDALESFNIVDLTQTLSKKVPTWDGACGFCSKIKKDYDQLFKLNFIEMEAGIGTHMDAPCHLFKEGLSIDKMPINNFIAKLVILDVSSISHADYEISIEDIEGYEKRYGLIPRGSLVIGYTGWSRFWNDSKAYRNADSGNQMHFPAFSAKAADILVKREVTGIAIDTLSPDCLDTTFPVHRIILGAGKYIIENIADCSQIPPKGAYAIALPIKLQDCTEAPIRIIALIPH